MHYMVPLFFYTHNFVIEEVLHYIKELYKFSHKWIKNTLHSFSHGLINFREGALPGGTKVLGLYVDANDSENKYCFQIFVS